MTLRVHLKPSFGFTEKIRGHPVAEASTAIVASAYPAVELGRKIHNRLRGTHLYIPTQFLQPAERVKDGVCGFEEPLVEVLQGLYSR